MGTDHAFHLSSKWDSGEFAAGRVWGGFCVGRVLELLLLLPQKGRARRHAFGRRDSSHFDSFFDVADLLVQSLAAQLHVLL